MNRIFFLLPIPIVFEGLVLNISPLLPLDSSENSTTESSSGGRGNLSLPLGSQRRTISMSRDASPNSEYRVRGFRGLYGWLVEDCMYLYDFFCLYEIQTYLRNFLYIFFRFFLDLKSWCLSVMWCTVCLSVLYFFFRWFIGRNSAINF
jgi:hypothetical protein